MPSRHRVSSVCHQRCCGTFTDITILNSNNLPLPLPESEGGERSKPVDSALQSALQCSGRFHKSLISLVGAGRFELPTPCSRKNGSSRHPAQSGLLCCHLALLGSRSVHANPGGFLGGGTRDVLLERRMVMAVDIEQGLH